MKLLCLPLFVLGMLAFAFSPGLAVQERQEKQAHQEKGEEHAAHQGEGHAGGHMECAKACNDCQLACDMCAAHCGKVIAEGKKEHLTTLQICQDCATVCSAAACIVARKGPFSEEICKACAEACKRCAKECDQFKDDPMMKKCAEECRKCEKACRDMLGHVETRK